MDVVFDEKVVALLRVKTFKCVGEYILGILDLIGIVVEVPLCVQVEIGDVIAHLRQVIRAGNVAGRVRWAHIRRNDPENVAKCHFVVIHLVIELRGRKSAEILVRPRVTSNLVTRTVHPLLEISVKHLVFR